MSEFSPTEASQLLCSKWRTGQVIQELPPAARPTTRAQGYEIQALLESSFSSLPLFGWKIAATSAAGQKHIGVDGPLAGRLLAEQVKSENDEISLTNNRMRVAECEFAFRMGQDLKPRLAPYSVDEVLKAVASLHPAIEIPDSRYTHFEQVGAPQLIADNACAHEFVLGVKTTSNWRAINLSSHAVTATITAHGAGAAPVHHHGVGSNVLGDPKVALTWLVNELSSLGITLAANQVVTTGTCVVPIAIEPGDSIRANFGAIGEVTSRFS